MDDKHAVVRRILVALLCLLMIFSVMTSVIPSAMAEESEAGRSAPVTEEPKESVVDGIGDVSGVRYYNDTWREDLGTTALDGYTMWYYEMADGTVYASTNNPDAPDLVPDDTAFANDAALTEVITENVEAMNKIDGVDVDVEAAAASVYQRAANGISLMAVNWPYTEDTNTQIRYYGDYPVNSSLKTINGRMAYCLDPNLYSPNPEDMYAFDAGVWNDATLYSILAYGYGGAHPVLNQGDLYDQYYATIMALVRHIGNANYWEGLDYPYHAFDYYQPAKDLLAYAKAHNVNTAAYTLYYAKPNGQGVKPYQRLVALSGERYGTIRVTKTSTETGEAVPGTTFLIDESVRVTTTSDGSVSVGGVTVGNHTIREIAVPAGYQLSGESKSVYVSPDSVATASFNNHHYGYIKIGKKDTESGAMVPGATFEVRNAGGTLVGTYTTGEDGTITTGDLEAGTYTITETAVPAPYWLGEESTRTGTVTVGWNGTSTYTKSNQRQKMMITAFKRDIDSGQAQADGTLAGAVFAVKDKDGNVVDTLTTDATGKTQVSKELDVGDYVLVETKAPAGYTLNATPVTVSGSYQGQNIKSFGVEGTVKNRVVKGKIAIHKYAFADSDKAEVPGTGELKGLEGAEFTLTLNSDPTNSKYTFTGTTDENGELYLSDVPYGNYTLVETYTPKGYKTIQPITGVNVGDDNRTYTYNLINEEMYSYLRVTKNDDLDGKVIAVAGTKYKVIDLNGTTPVFLTQYPTSLQFLGKSEWTTGDNGKLVLDKELKAGDYALVEIQAPEGYQSYRLSHPEAKTYAVDGKDYAAIPFTVSQAGATIEKDGEGKDYYITDANTANLPAKGRIKVIKTGEMLNGSHPQSTKYGEQSVFDWSQQPLAGVTFNVYANKDIIGAPDADGNVRVYQKAGDLVATLTTGIDGAATTGDLYLGEYRMVEVLAPDGYIINTDEPIITIGYQGQDVVAKDNIETVQVSDSRQNPEFRLLKQEQKLVNVGWDGQKTVIQYDQINSDGIVFGLYTAQDIESGGGRAVAKDSLVDIVTIKDGRGQTTAQLPAGQYYLKEVETHDYLDLLETTYPVAYEPQGNDAVISITANDGNVILNHWVERSVDVFKSEVSDGQGVAGATFTFTDKAGNTVFIGTTDATGHLDTPKLPLAEYTCTETQAPAPYLLNTEKQAFEIKKSDTTITLEFTNTLAMANLSIKKTGQDREHWKVTQENGEAVIHYETKDIAGAVFNVVAQEDIITAEGIVRARKGDVVAKMTTDAKGEAHVTEAYFLTKGADATRTAGQNFDLTTMAEQTFERPASIATPINPAGTVKMVKPETNLFLTKQGEDWSALYNVIEAQAPDGYRLSDEIHNVVIPYQDERTDVVWGNTEAFDEALQGDIVISKTEVSDGQPLPNTKVNIYDGKKKLIYTGTTNDNGEITMKHLLTGTYFYQETQAPAPYLCSDEMVEFIIQDGQITRARMTDTQAMANLSIKKTGQDRDHWEVVTENETVTVKYQTKDIQGATFNVVAQEDIITAEGIVRARKGDIVAKMTTDAKGEAHVTEAYFLTKGADAIRVAGQNFDLTTMSGQTFNRPEEMATKLNPAGQVEVVKKENNLFLTKQGESWTALYNVIEDQAPDGYRLSDEIHGVVIPYQDDHTPLVIGNTTAFDDSQQGKIEISKTEISDGQALPNTKVNIYDVNMKVIFTGITNEKGEVSIQNLPTGKYFYQEMEAPAPYRCSDEVFPFEIKDKVVTRAVMSDRLIMGNLLLSKTANDPDHYKVVTDDGVNKTEYETIPSEGAEFDVKASQDIITPEGIVRARSGDTVAKITTDEKGEAQISEAYFLTKGADATRTDGQIFDLTTMTEQTFERPASIATPVNPAGQAVAVQQEDNLYLTQVDNTWKATYEAVETKAASDRWQLDPQAHGGVAAYQDDHTPVVTDTIKAFDKATEAPFKLSKADITTGKPIPNTEINIYNAKKDCIFTGTTDNEGKLTLSNLPKGDYFYQETKAPEPFLCSDELYPFTITDEGISIEVTMTDKLAKGSVELRKFGQNDIDYVVGQDGTITYQSNVPLAGAEYAIKADRDIVIAGVVRAQKDDTISRIKTDEEGKAVSSEVYYMAGDGNNTRKDQPADISKMDESLIRKEDGLYVGDYYLVETKAPLSYRLSEERLKFTIHYIDDHTAILDTASLQAEDLAKQGGVEIKKTDLSTGAALEGATIKLFDATQKLIYTGISNKQGRIAISGLPEGKYYYQESGAPEGYELDSTLYAFEIKDDAITKCEITNKPISVNTGLDQSNPTLSVVIILVTLSGLTLTTCLNKRR